LLVLVFIVCPPIGNLLFIVVVVRACYYSFAPSWHLVLFLLLLRQKQCIWARRSLSMLCLSSRDPFLYPHDSL